MVEDFDFSRKPRAREDCSFREKGKDDPRHTEAGEFGSTINHPWGAIIRRWKKENNSRQKEGAKRGGSKIDG